MHPILRLIRPKQWSKNVLVFAGIIFAKRYLDVGSWVQSFKVFFAFSLVASSIYVFNDLCDVEKDRAHPIKKNRPIAAGEVNTITAVTLSAVLLAIGLSWAYTLGEWVFVLMTGYALMMVLYSLWLKHLLLVDVFVIALGFMTRPLVGAAAIDVHISRWLMVCAFFIGLTLSMIKRRQELARLGGHVEEGRRSLQEAPPIHVWDMWINMLSAITILAYTLYTFDPVTVAHVGSQKLMFTTPIVVFALLRYQSNVYTRDTGEDPTDAVLSDPWILTSLLAWGAMVLLVLTGRL